MQRNIVLFGLIIASSPQVWCQALPPVTIQSVVNSASFQRGLPSAGGLATIFVSGLAPNQVGIPPVGLTVAPASQPLPKELAGIQVLIDGGPAPILAVYIPAPGSSANAQINIQVPTSRGTAADFSPGTTVQVAGATLTTTNLSAGVGGFFSDANGNAIAEHASDFSLVTAQNPAHPGETIIVYADDFFPTWPPPPIGIPVPAQYSVPADPTQDIGYEYFGRLLFLQTPPVYVPPINQSLSGYSCPSTPPIQVAFEGLAPGQIGAERIDFVVPANQQPGNWALFFNTISAYGVNCGPFNPASSSTYVLLPVD